MKLQIFCSLFGLFLFVILVPANDIFLNQKNSISSKIEGMFTFPLTFWNVCCTPEIIPKDARRFYNELSTEDKDVLQDVVENRSKYATTEALLDDIKGRSSVLYDKAMSLVTGFRESLDSLGPDARKFVDDVRKNFIIFRNIA